jgi:hypothetical protein
MIWLNVLLLLFVQADGAPVPPAPEKSGIYFHQNTADWVSLQPAVASDSKAKGMGLFVYSDGLTNLGLDITCPGAKASTRLSVPKPTFYSRGVGSAKDAMLIRLTQRKESRICRTSFSNVTVDNKGGFRKGDIQKLETAEYPDGSFSVTPAKELPPGEYLVVFGNTVSGYDFGIDKAK